LETAQAHIKTHNDEIAVLKANIKPAWQGRRPAKLTINDNYFWSHVHQVHKDHTIVTCKANKDGRKDAAIKDNIMGG
jgi:hypothetical protein